MYHDTLKTLLYWWIQEENDSIRNQDVMAINVV